MIRIYEGGGGDGKKLAARLRQRRGKTSPAVESAVADILEGVRRGGDRAVREYTLRFDGALPKKTELTDKDMEDAAASCSKEFLGALSRAAENIRRFHERQKQNSWFITRPDGVVMGQRVRPLARVGVYVPGGTAAYPSSVLMNVIPAKIAGVGEIIMATPPGREGKPSPAVLAAARKAGVDRVFLIGGAQAVAALAYGTETVPAVEKIVGPGNIYVATAKKQLFGTVGVDMIAGPSEILILADETADPEYLAADLMSQAEHDPLASAVLLTTSPKTASAVQSEIDRQIKGLSRRAVIEKSLDSYGAVVVFGTLEEAIRFANDFAPEHLEICTRNPMELLGRVDNAGSVFLGNYSPEPVGDYYAGPNHVLPTGGTARFSSPLSVDTFLKKSGFLYYTKDALSRSAEDIETLARAEGLTAHANAVRVRRNSIGVPHE